MGSSWPTLPFAVYSIEASPVRTLSFRSITVLVDSMRSASVFEPPHCFRIVSVT
jgi:hypothetical protein